MALRSAGEVAAKMRTSSEAAQKAATGTVTKAALLSKTAIAAGAPTSLRGVGKKGAKLGIRYTVTGSGSKASARLRATGPWQLIESDTSAHEIRPKKRSKARGRGRMGAIVIPGVGPRVAAHHPGTKGKHPWSKGVDKAEPLAAAEMRKQTTNTVVAAFRG